MIRRLSILFVLFIVGCSTEPTDCAGVAGGDAKLDNCNVCDTDLTNDCVQGCDAIWGSGLVLDECGICDGDGIDEGEVALWGKCYSIEETTELELSIVDIQGGEIPSEIGNLINLTTLDLHYYRLTGDIPSEIGNLINLTTLSLYSNRYTGEIPVEIGNLTNLTTLSLYANRFTGEIPSEICNLTKLTWSYPFVDLTYSYIYQNMLCPPHPGCIEDYVGNQVCGYCDENPNDPVCD